MLRANRYFASIGLTSWAFFGQFCLLNGPICTAHVTTTQCPRNVSDSDRGRSDHVRGGAIGSPRPWARMDEQATQTAETSKKGHVTDSSGRRSYA
ncbi:hypothetical protein PVAP13_9KG081020 [Panicum virgatum]|uniref:Secreted protein n=1 Tax=Panicum virgatum TaxID=38727 RepID=A0A8T0NGU7_PANVG|nr:hypothetical protein PVAP13_9KG081020 [Panicum virgatum]